jgi:hypothetical protein
MRRLFSSKLAFVAVFAVVLASTGALRVRCAYAASDAGAKHEFHTSDRCVACHNGLKTREGEDVSIGLEWRASIMANASRDPYWQASIRRESIDHPESSKAVEDECSTCHMPIPHFTAQAEGHKAEVFSHFPLTANHPGRREAMDGVSCSVCHQIEANGLGSPQTFSGQVQFASPQEKHARPEYGPFDVDAAHQRIMQSSTAGFQPIEAAHIRDAGLCGSCHTLYTKARGEGGKEIGVLPEQMPYLEWLHSDYVKRQTCQECHMPAVKQPVRVAAVFGPEREGLHRHVFVGGNTLMERMLHDHHDELAVQALPEELDAALKRTAEFVENTAARVSIANLETSAKHLTFAVLAENLTGHKLPTAYPSRRVWLHVTVRDDKGQKVFESGALNPDGSIQGNDNDADKTRFEPHYTEITRPDEVQIFEPILGDDQGRVTTGLLSAVKYLKDNRLLPSGFDKNTASHDIAVVGAAKDDPNFTDKGSLTRYAVDTGSADGPFHVEAELWYQPVGFRWAHNLEPYKAVEPQRFVSYYQEEAQHSAVILALAEATK